MEEERCSGGKSDECFFLHLVVWVENLLCSIIATSAVKIAARSYLLRLWQHKIILRHQIVEILADSHSERTECMRCPSSMLEVQSFVHSVHTAAVPCAEDGGGGPIQEHDVSINDDNDETHFGQTRRKRIAAVHELHARFLFHDQDFIGSAKRCSKTVVVRTFGWMCVDQN